MTVTNSPTTSASMPTRPVSNTPLTFPTQRHTDLSPDAQALLAWATKRDGRLDRDVLNPGTHREHVTRDAWLAFTPTPQMQTAIDEIQTARLGRYEKPGTHSGASLRPVLLEEGYTVAFGRGPYLIKVSAVSLETATSGALLAVLVGAGIEQSTRAEVPLWDLRVRHETATDFEHDAASVAILTVANPTTPDFDPFGGSWSVIGTLTEARTYPLGTDPVLVDADDRSVRLDSPRMCEGKGEGWDEERHQAFDEPHPFAPYIPSRTNGSGPRMVRVDVYPIRPWLVADAGRDAAATN